MRDDRSGLPARARFGLWLVHVLAWLQTIIYRRVIRGTVWRSADGRVMLVSQMTDRHLLNSIRMLERAGDQQGRARELYAELSSRPWCGRVPR